MSAEDDIAGLGSNTVTTEGEIDAKKKFIEAFFSDFGDKIARIKKMMSLGFVEEALILACCYISALANFRYNRKADRDNFVKAIYEYSRQKDLFAKISWIDFYKKGKDGKGNRISNYETIKTALLKKYEKKCDHRQEMDKDGIIDYLKSELENLDFCNLEANMDKFSYAAVLYKEYRCAGVHEGSMANTWDAKTGKPSFEKSIDGDAIYYSGNTLCFSKEIIIAVLENIHGNLRSKCIGEIKWPNELQ